MLEFVLIVPDYVSKEKIELLCFNYISLIESLIEKWWEAHVVLPLERNNFKY